MNDFRRGALDSIGLGGTAMLFAVIFGSAAVAKGLTFVEALSLSAFVFAGSVQFATISIWGDVLPLATILLSGFLIASRNIFMGMALGHVFVGQPAWQKYLKIFIYTDISYVLGMRAKHIENKFAYICGSGVFVYCLWISGTVIGLLIAGSLQKSIVDSLAYAGVMYLGMLVIMLMKTGEGLKTPILLAAMTILALYLLNAEQFLIMLGGVSVGGLSNLWLELRNRKNG
ncbi:MAG: AzlC family ABC transporter permease [Hyphomicrobiales bacterium]